MSKLGYGHCPVKGSGAFYSLKLEHECRDFEQVDAKVEFKRRDWLIRAEVI